MFNVTYFDDYGIKHLTLLNEEWEINIIKERFSLVKVEVQK